MEKTCIVRELIDLSISKAIEVNHINGTTKTIEQGIKEANYHLSRQLDVPLGTKLFYIKKVRIIDGETRSVETAHMVYNKVKGIENEDFNDKSFYTILKEKTGIQPRKCKEEIMIVEPTKEEAQILGIPVEDEVMLIKGTTSIDGAEPFEYFEIVAESSFYRYKGGMSAV